MIRYPIRPRQLRDALEEARPGWLARAGAATDKLRTAGSYEAGSNIWSQIKRPYMRLQHFKCGFCERRLERSAYGNVEHDVEHFRPKAKVDSWPTDAIRAERAADITFETGADRPGYHTLAYHEENYLIACKTCNSALKRNFFPIAPTATPMGETPRELRSEKPLLIYPIGASDNDPEDLISFRGIVPIPVGTRGHKRRRAIATIRMFELDTRERLLQERAESIVALHLAMNQLDHRDPVIATLADRSVRALIGPAAAHANCMRAHHDLLINEPGLAADFALAALDWILG